MKIYKIPENLKTIIFDIDETLYTNHEYAQFQIDVLIDRYAKETGISSEQAHNNVAEYQQNYIKTHDGKKISLGNTLKALGIPIETTTLWRNELIFPEEFLCSDIRLQNVLQELKSKYSLICVTNNSVLPAAKTLKALGIENIITDIIGLDVSHVSKPAKEPFIMAAQKTGARCEECLAVGDRFYIDIDLPMQIGMGGILVDGVEDIYEFPDLLGC